jgi:MFS family permease
VFGLLFRRYCHQTFNQEFITLAAVGIFLHYKEYRFNPNKLPHKARIMLVGIALSALGNGLVLPYTFIYFHNVRGFPIAVAGLIASYGALTSLAISPLVGNFIDKWGPKPVLLASLVISSVGYCGLSLVKTIQMAFFVTTICAIGQAAMWPSQSAISTELTPEPLR